MKKTEEEWRRELSPELYRIAREKGTEAPFSGKYTFTKEKGVYRCMVCGNPLFDSGNKFDTKVQGLMGWPSFDKALPGAIKFVEDDSAGMNRIEVVCANCGSHLGHVFDDKSEGETGKHYCINCASLDLQKKK